MKLQGKVAIRVVGDGPKRSQESPRWPPKGSQAYGPWILPMIAARLGCDFWAAYVGASGGRFGDVLEGVWLRSSGLGRAKLSLTCVKEGRS